MASLASTLRGGTVRLNSHSGLVSVLFVLVPPHCMSSVYSACLSFWGISFHLCFVLFFGFFCMLHFLILNFAKVRLFCWLSYSSPWFPFLPSFCLLAGRDKFFLLLWITGYTLQRKMFRCHLADISQALPSFLLFLS